MYNDIFFKKVEKNTNIQNKVDNYSRNINTNECLVSKASKEIMLDRVCNGNPNVFPFSE